MEVIISDDKETMGRKAAGTGAARMRQVINARGEVNIVLATGASQFEMLDALVDEDLDWGCVTAFHLDEYVGLPETHPASFRKYLRERFEEKLPKPLADFHYIDAEGDCAAEIERLNALISDHPIDVAFIGIGENGHLAFNDPPADFETEQPFIVVELDEACRQQQVGEGWFDGLEDVPKQAISMSMRQIMKSDNIICTVPDERKAEAVRNALEGEVTPHVPASLLQEHPACYMFLDRASASLLSE
jgi:glucosamine-6-phosphate deaminase